jgi:hypothetical protein
VAAARRALAGLEALQYLLDTTRSANIRQAEESR